MSVLAHGNLLNGQFAPAWESAQTKTFVSLLPAGQSRLRQMTAKARRT
jgi:hypothetical protein